MAKTSKEVEERLLEASAAKDQTGNRYSLTADLMFHFDDASVSMIQLREQRAALVALSLADKDRYHRRWRLSLKKRHDLRVVR